MTLRLLDLWMGFGLFTYGAAFFGQPAVYYYWWKFSRKESWNNGAKWRPSITTIGVFLACAMAPIWTVGFSTTAHFEGKASLRYYLFEFARAQAAYREKTGAYACGPDIFHNLDWGPPNQALQYVWYVGDQVWPPDLAMMLDLGKDWPFAIKPGMSPQGFTLVAVGNLDKDLRPEVWYINNLASEPGAIGWGEVLDEDLYAPGKSWTFPEGVAQEIADNRRLAGLRMRYPNRTANILILSLPVLLILLLTRDEVRRQK